MMAAGRGGQGKEPQESGNGLERLYLKAAPFIYYGTYNLGLGLGLGAFPTL